MDSWLATMPANLLWTLVRENLLLQLCYGVFETYYCTVRKGVGGGGEEVQREGG